MLNNGRMLSSFLSLLLLINLALASGPSWADHGAGGGRPGFPFRGSHNFPNGRKPRPNQFRIQVSRSGRRYQTGKRYWAFSGDDAIVTDNINDAAWFSIKNGHLKSNNKFVNLDGGSGYSVLELSEKPANDGCTFSRSNKGDIDITRRDFSVGKGHGIFCASDDGNIFVVGSKKPPFRCYGLGLRSKGPVPPSQGQPSSQEQPSQDKPAQEQPPSSPPSSQSSPDASAGRPSSSPDNGVPHTPDGNTADPYPDPGNDDSDLEDDADLPENSDDGSHPSWNDMGGEPSSPGPSSATPVSPAKATSMSSGSSNTPTAGPKDPSKPSSGSTGDHPWKDVPGDSMKPTSTPTASTSPTTRPKDPNKTSSNIPGAASATPSPHEWQDQPDPLEPSPTTTDGPSPTETDQSWSDETDPPKPDPSSDPDPEEEHPQQPEDGEDGEEPSRPHGHGWKYWGNAN
ncbi:uncharacterized protein HMPREF1541_09576 [Cyphellophora europaea CBS 101466]|uniref:DUF7908 domain-containing protein n=1 Tax=Cyphellophora europaea (strain CBS 101466) TaxID=1220924 RepID=W2SCH9_CYPE1|nr:uncharacterized protein HMPREF1541_09576 [Cyphellophora europaea CBS 101466]ETN45743.1 hypothetical protein HMPREF1541_09576 [Cyphellophora europaea CBS 101466]